MASCAWQQSLAFRANQAPVLGVNISDTIEGRIVLCVHNAIRDVLLLNILRIILRILRVYK